MRVVKRVEEWWDRTAPTRRLDRNAANMCLLIGLVMSSFSVLAVGPSPSSALHDMTDTLQLAMCVCIFLGCMIKLFGALCHSPMILPRMKVRTCYQIGVAGAPLAASGLFVYGWFLLENTPTWTSAIGAVLTPMLGVGILIQSVFYLLEARRIGRNERIMIRDAEQVIRSEQRHTD